MKSKTKWMQPSCKNSNSKARRSEQIETFSYPYRITMHSEFTSICRTKVAGWAIGSRTLEFIWAFVGCQRVLPAISESVNWKVSRLWTSVISHSPLSKYLRETDVKQNINSVWFLQKTNYGRIVMHTACMFEGKR